MRVILAQGFMLQHNQLIFGVSPYSRCRTFLVSILPFICRFEARNLSFDAICAPKMQFCIHFKPFGHLFRKK